MGRSSGWISRWNNIGPVVAITGSSKGIGRSLAIGLAHKGARVALLSRDEERMANVVAKIRERNGEAIAIATDVTEEESVRSAVRSVVDRFGSLDGMIANSGIAEVGPALETSADSFRRVVEVNLVGAFITAREAGKVMIEHGAGSVILIGSTFASSAIVDWSSYSASKAGVLQLGRVLALEWAAQGVRVNAMCPTATLTDQNRALFADPRFEEQIVSRIPVGRLLQPDELTEMAALLLSDATPMITGQAIYVDGGWTLP